MRALLQIASASLIVFLGAAVLSLALEHLGNTFAWLFLLGLVGLFGYAVAYGQSRL